MSTAVLWRLQTSGTLLRSVTPLTSGVCPTHGRRRRPHMVGGNNRIGYIQRGRCSPVFLWDDLPQPGGMVACLKRHHASPGCGFPHGWRCRRHLERGNGRVGSTRRGSCCGFGPDVASKCSYGLTQHNRVERSTDQSPSVKS